MAVNAELLRATLKRHALIVKIVVALAGVFGVLSWVDAVPGDFDPVGSIGSGHFFLASAFLGSYIIYAFAGRPRTELVWVTMVGLTLELILGVGRVAADVTTVPRAFLAVGGGLGIASMVALVPRAVAGPPVQRLAARYTLAPMLVLPAYVMMSFPALTLTASMHPQVLDLNLMLADSTIARPIVDSVVWLFANVPGVEKLSLIAYVSLPSICAFVFAFNRRRGAFAHGDLLVEFVLIGAIGYIFYHLIPVVGPGPFGSASFGAFGTGGFAQGPPFVSRNCVPSLHTAWALSVLLHTRSGPLWFRAIGGALFLFTALATLGFQYHYFLDLVVAVPLLVLIRCIVVPHAPQLGRLRRDTALVAGAMLLVWTALLLWAPALLAGSVPLTVALCVASVVVPLIMEANLVRSRKRLPFEIEHASTKPKDSDVPIPQRGAMTALFVMSGFAGLAYEVVFAKSLALTFGSTASAATTVLATYMGGIAVGSWLGGRIGQRRNDPVRFYAFCEAGIGVWCLLSPVLFGWIQDVYIGIAAGVVQDTTALLALRVALGAFVLLPPTILMGITMPVLLKHFERKGGGLGRPAARLYAANTIGAALGSLLTGYLVLPQLGIIRTTTLAAGLNFAAAAIALFLFRKGLARGAVARLGRAVTPTGATAISAADRRLGVVALVLLGAGGAVTLAMETVYVHLLAVISGNSAYAFALMLFCFLAGLGIGAAIGRDILGRVSSLPFTLVAIEFALAFSMMVGLFLWSGLPEYFAGFAGYPMTVSFQQRELVRFVVCCLGLLPPAICIGMLYPVAIEAVSRAWTRRPIIAIGRASALNTVGNIVGAILGGFVLVPVFGSFDAVLLCAAICVALGVLAAVAGSADARRLAFASCSVLALVFFLLPSDFDYTRLASGANVYFQAAHYGEVIDHAESMDGGLTTIALSPGADGDVVKTMLTNGKFQGDNSIDREVKAQLGFALAPLMHTSERERAAVIGFGTGTSARVLANAGFREVHVVDLSEDVLRMADKHFQDVNQGALHRPNVTSHVADGRNYLMLETGEFDLISMEISSIWFAGAASLYNREYYELVKSRLSQKGVLQQWVQLHRLSPQDIASVIATVSEVFENTWLYFIGQQGIIVACERDCRPRLEYITRLDSRVELIRDIEPFQGSAAALLRERLLDPAAVAQFLKVYEETLGEPPVISTDDNLYLEYSTPRGNVREYGSSMRQNLSLLARFKPQRASDGTRLDKNAISELNRRLGFVQPTHTNAASSND